jgi:calcineurin-like phosphoesterase family protein
MSRNLYIADTHFGHGNILRFDNRPFSTVEEMELELVNRWAMAVEPKDTVYILGDFCWGKEDEWLRILSQLKGNKVLIRGNHDLKNMSIRLRNHFQDVKDYKEITDEGRHVILSHYPMLLYKGSYNPDCYMLCGHVHVTRENVFLEEWTDILRQSRKQNSDSCGNIINTGCMMPWMDYTPRTLDEIIERRFGGTK